MLKQQISRRKSSIRRNDVSYPIARHFDLYLLSTILRNTLNLQEGKTWKRKHCQRAFLDQHFEYTSVYGP